MLWYRLFWLLAVCAALETTLAQGEKFCVTEELPTGVKFQGSYGAKSPIEFPVSVTISSPAGVLYRSDDIPENARFSFSVVTSGVYQLCFIGATRKEGKKIRNISFDLDVGSVFTAQGASEESVSKLSLINVILADVREVREDFLHMKHREHHLRTQIRKLGTTAVLVSVFCILISCIGMVFIGQWTRINVKKRM